jgi:hypothetical protein
LSGPGYRLAETLVHIDRVLDEGAGRRERQSRSGAPTVQTSPNTCRAERDVCKAVVISCECYSDNILRQDIACVLKKLLLIVVVCNENSFCVVLCCTADFYEVLIGLAKDVSVITRLSLVRRK